MRLLLETKGNLDIVSDVSDGTAAVEAAQALEPDVVVLDIAMAGMNGLAVTRAIKHRVPHVAVVALTRHSESVYVQELLAAGASAYVLKQSPFDVLLTAIAAAAAGNRFVDPAIDGHAATPPKANPAARAAASDREITVLRLAASGKSNKDIAQALNIAVKTVEVHKANAMRKLHIPDREHLIQFAVMSGWMHDS